MATRSPIAQDSEVGLAILAAPERAAALDHPRGTLRLLVPYELSVCIL
jgi:hypothetical protein